MRPIRSGLSICRPPCLPARTSQKPGYLEYPDEALAYYRHEGAAAAVCQQKHMGSRAVVVLCRDERVAVKRFGVSGEGRGICYTRTGRRFFNDTTMETAFLDRVARAMDRSKLWETLESDWVCLDCELMPWSVKAQVLLQRQYAPAGSAAVADLRQTLAVVEANAEGAGTLAGTYRERLGMATAYVDAYRRYCWPVRSLDDLRLAPFHLLASEGHVYADRDHLWHMQTLARLAEADREFLIATPHRVVNLTDTGEQKAAVEWWEQLTESGGEGMVVKPLSFVHRGRKGLAQPAVKCRGREYLRIIYGPEYTRDEHLVRLRHRGLGGKRSLAIREFALGIEGLQRFVRQEPLRRVHECVFGVLALESEPVDPRL